MNVIITMRICDWVRPHSTDRILFMLCFERKNIEPRQTISKTISIGPYCSLSSVSNQWIMLNKLQYIGTHAKVCRVNSEIFRRKTLRLHASIVAILTWKTIESELSTVVNECSYPHELIVELTTCSSIACWTLCAFSSPMNSICIVSSRPFLEPGTLE